MHRARLAHRVPADELRRIRVGRVVLDVVRRDDLERDAELLEDRPPLRARRREGQAALASYPQILRGPLARPLGRGGVVVLVRLRALGREELHEALELEARRVEEVDQVAVAGVELDAVLERPAEAVHALLWAQQLLGGRPGVVGDTQHRRAGCSAGRRAAHPAAAGVQPRAASVPGRTRCSRRTPRRRDRTSHRAAARPPRSPRRAGTRSRSRPCTRRAVSSCAGVTSTPTGRAPRLASQAEKYAVPQPSSTTSSPTTSPRIGDVVLAHAEDAPGDLSSPHAARPSRRCTRRSSSSRARGCEPRSPGAQTRPSGKKSASSRRALAFESEPWTMFSESSSA